MLGENSHRCSFQKGVINKVTCTFPSTHPFAGQTHGFHKKETCQSDISLHNATFYLKDEGGYRDIWLVKREMNG